MITLLKTIGIGIGLCIGWPLRKAKALRPMPHFWWLVLLNIALTIALQSWQLRGQLKQYSAEGLLADGFAAMLTLGAATAVLATVKKQVFAFSLATLLLGSQLLLGCIWVIANDLLSQSRVQANLALLMLGTYALWWIIVSYRGLGMFQLGINRAKQFALSVLFGALTLWPYFGVLRIEFPRYVLFDDSQLYDEETALAEPPVTFDAEAVIYAQHQMLERSVRRIRPGLPGTPELFVVALAGDAGENTFLNEVVYARNLFERRFSARGRSLVLANHPRTTAKYPLATLSNLRAALKGIAQKMDLEEDLLFLFLTSHGSPTHEFALELAPLPLNQITPQKLAAALSDAGIKRRVVLVSACYSGGYVEALSGTSTVVMTAARADRTSFGCGGDFDMTYFGRAYLLEALNQNKDLLKAFQSAELSIAEREVRENQVPSLPQMRIGKDAPAMLASWKRSFIVGDPVPFFVAEETKIP